MALSPSFRVAFFPRIILISFGIVQYSRLGIGTVSPSSALHVTSDALINSVTIGRGGGNSTTNTAIGYGTLLRNTTGTSNTGSENVVIGYYGMQGNTTGNGLVAIGANTGGPQTTAYNSIYIGKSAQSYASDEHNAIVIGNEQTIGAGTNTAVIGNSSITDVYFGSSSANANTHAKKMYLGSSSVPGCIVMGDTAGGVGYITLDNGSLTVSSSPPTACQ